MNDEKKTLMHERWAQLRFSVVGQLLSRPPQKGTLSNEIKELSAKDWTHPQTGEAVRFGFSTIEHWYHRAKRSDNPIKALTTEARADCGKSRVISAAILAALRRQYELHSGWSYFLHYENIAVVAADDPSAFGEMPSYSTLRRLMKRSGWTKKKRPKKLPPGKLAAIERKETLETRSYEASYVGELCHLDFHIGSLCVVDAAGVWHKPEIFAMTDDLSRLCCHAQWYLTENSENLIHGSEQAFLKRGLFRSLMSDRGSAMMSEEYQNGLRDLSILHQPTLGYSPNQNGKQERFWATLEGQLMAMLENVEHLTLDQLNLYTQAWIEQGYNQKRHDELKCSPVEKFLAGPSVLRPSVDLAQMRLAFSKQTVRKQRKSDGTLSLDGVRFEIPSTLRLLDIVTVRYRPWDLSKAYIVDPRSGVVLAVIRPLNKQKNADGKRRAFENPLPIPVPVDIKDSERVAPVLKKMMANYAASGLPAAYIPKDELILAKAGMDKEE